MCDKKRPLKEGYQPIKQTESEPSPKSGYQPDRGHLDPKNPPRRETDDNEGSSDSDDN